MSCSSFEWIIINYENQMIHIDISTLSIVLGIIATLLSGAIWVMAMASRISSRVTNEKNRITKLENDLSDLRISANLKIEKVEFNQKELQALTNSEKEVNEAFRHKYKTSLDHLCELIEMKFTDFDKSFNQFRELIATKIDLAVAKSKIEKEKR
jgi:triphosphoribosyl-dephospho-CoA synthetase